MYYYSTFACCIFSLPSSKSMFAVNNFLIIIVVICVIHISRKYLVHHKTNNGIGLHTIHILIDMQLLPTIWFSTFIMSLSPKKA